MQHFGTIRSVCSTNISSVSREIRRNKPPERNRYTPRVAHERALRYRKHHGKRKLDKDDRLKGYVVSRLKLGWAPEQIAATAKEVVGVSISHEAVYQYIYAQVYRAGYGYLKPGREDLRPYLVWRRKRRMRKGLRKSYRIEKGLLPSIDLRSKEVERCTAVGHWEEDSLVYTPICPVRLRTMNERRSGVVFITKAYDRTMVEANRITRDRLGAYCHRVSVRRSRAIVAQRILGTKNWNRTLVSAASSLIRIMHGSAARMRMQTASSEDSFPRAPISVPFQTRKYEGSSMSSIPDPENVLAGIRLIRYSMN